MNRFSQSAWGTAPLERAGLEPVERAVQPAAPGLQQFPDRNRHLNLQLDRVRAPGPIDELMHSHMRRRLAARSRSISFSVLFENLTMRRREVMRHRAAASVLMSVLSLACIPGSSVGDDSKDRGPGPKDWHTLSNPEQLQVTHVDLNLTVDFHAKALDGTAALDFKRQPGCPVDAPLKLDTNGLVIRSVAGSAGGKEFAAVPYTLGPAEGFRGRALTISIGPETDRVRIAYRTTSESKALQWLDPASTAGGKHPFLCTQSESILARSWIPLQDTPGVRVTYSATIHTPPGLRAVDRAPMRRARTARHGDGTCPSRSRPTS